MEVRSTEHKEQSSRLEEDVVIESSYYRL